jgi:uncharacterized protein
MRIPPMRVVATFCTLALFVSPATAQEQEPLTEAKGADIGRLAQLTGSRQLGLQLADVIIHEITNQMKILRPDIPPRATEIVREEVMKLLEERIGALMERMVPIYHQHFSHEEIKGLLQFYETALGRKLIQSMPAIMQQSMTEGQTWGQSLAPVLTERLRLRLTAEGIK